MAFELPPLPSFNVQTPDVLAKASEGAQLRNMLSEMALRQALAPSQVQQAQAQAQQAQQSAELQKIQLQDSQAFSNYIKNGSTASDFSGRDKVSTLTGMDKNDPYMSVLAGLSESGMSGLGLMNQAQTAIQRRTEYNKGTVEQQNIQKANYEVFKDALARITNADPKEWGPLVADALPRLAQATRLSPELDSLVKLLQQNPQVGVPIAANAVAAQEKQLGLRKAAAEATTAEQGVIGPTGQSAKELSENAQKVAQLPTELAKVTAETRAREQVQASMLPLMEQVRQQFANQKDARDKIETTVLKPYQDKLTDITTARAALAQAADNPVAARAAIFKMIGVAQPTGSHRVLPAEIAAFQYPGGIATNIKERFNNFLKGEPWTPEIAQAAESFISGQENAATTSLNSGIDRTNKLYGTNVGTGLQQAAAPTALTPPSPAAAGMKWQHRTVNGNVEWRQVKQ